MQPKNDLNLIKKARLILVIGNSRLHWAWFQEKCLIKTWDTSHLVDEIKNNLIPQELLSPDIAKQNLTSIPIKIASVVPQQTKLWQNYDRCQVITLKDIGLKNIYSTMGIDRALALWAGGEIYGYPCLVIDGGTALTFTGTNQGKHLIGGAILPGLRSQFITLNQKTAALPKVELPATLPPRWASNTEQAIASGILYTVMAGIHSYILDWKKKYPHSQIIFTGGDGEMLTQYLQQLDPEINITCDRNLIFHGINLVSCNN